MPVSVLLLTCLPLDFFCSLYTRNSFPQFIGPLRDLFLLLKLALPPNLKQLAIPGVPVSIPMALPQESLFLTPSKLVLPNTSFARHPALFLCSTNHLLKCCLTHLLMMCVSPHQNTQTTGARILSSSFTVALPVPGKVGGAQSVA